MERESFFTPLIVIGLVAFFLALSFMVFLSNGNKKLISRKIKIGASIIALTTFINTGGIAQETCYDPVDPDAKHVQLTNAQYKDGKITIENDKNLEGILTNLDTSKYYYYELCDESGDVLSTNTLRLEKETWKISFMAVIPDKYILRIIEAENKEDESNNKTTWQYNIQVIEGRDEIINTCYF